jgi:hypothetical protein
MKNKLSQYVLAVSVTFMSCNGYATIVYTDETTFLTDVGAAPVAVESFESAPTGDSTTSLAFPAADLSCDGSTWCSDFFGVSTLMPTEGSQGVYFATPDSITFTFATPITAFAIDVGDLGTRGATDFSATLSNGNEISFFTEYTGSSFGQLFVGVIDDTEFTSITFHGSIADDGIYFDRMQTAMVTLAVPEPETYALLLAGLALLGVSASRRKKANIYTTH